MSTPFDTYKIHDQMFGVGEYHGIGVKKIGAIKTLREMIHEVFGPFTFAGTTHNVGLKEVKDYVENDMNIYQDRNDAEHLIYCMFWKANVFWMTANGLNLVGLQETVQQYYEHGIVRIFNAVGDGPNATVADLTVQEMTGQIIGWRTFRYENQEIRPLSHRWHEFSIVGKTIDTAPDPDIDNEYGFWCFKKKSYLLKYLQNWYGAFGRTSSFLHATVLLTGDIVEHELGFRAKEIEVLGLYSDLNNSQRRGIAHKLGWPGKVLPTNQGQEEFPYNITEV